VRTEVAHAGVLARAELLNSGVLIVEFSGLILADGLAALKREIVADLALAPGPVAVVADYSAAVLALTERQGAEMMTGGGPENLVALPAVVISPQQSRGLLQRAAEVAAGRGEWRAVVRDRRAAADSVARMLSLAAAVRQEMPR
jgi:hypothetical protein